MYQLFIPEIVFVAVMFYYLGFHITLTILSFDKDKEIYQMSLLLRFGVFLIWPGMYVYYLGRFVGNIFGKLYVWSK